MDIKNQIKPSLPQITIITLNYNSFPDTIECLESVLKLHYPNFNVIVIDNHSTDDSWLQLCGWAKGEIVLDVPTQYADYVHPLVKKPIEHLCAEMDFIVQIGDQKPKVLLLLNQCNEGFARANNRGIRLAFEHYHSQYVFLLNNDTVIAPDALGEIVSVMETRPEIAASQSVIYHYTDPEKIANAGGCILPWGQTKYRKKISKEPSQRVTFLNGCALILRQATVQKYGALTEDFFHGEEDFEFSMRLARHKALKVCVNRARVFHKIGVTAHGLMAGQVAKKVLLFAINRIVDMKQFYSRPLWILWRELALIYFFLMLCLHYRVRIRSAGRTINTARKVSAPLIKVNDEVVHAIVNRQSL